MKRITFIMSAVCVAILCLANSGEPNIIDLEIHPSSPQDFYIMRDPILIEGDEDFTPENGVNQGDGTQENPFIIEDYLISGLEYSEGISISETTKYCIIRDVIITDIQRGISLSYADNIQIEECQIKNIYGLDGEDGSAGAYPGDGYHIRGISAENCDNLSIVLTNIHHLYGGDGGDGYVSSDQLKCSGGDAGSASGILVLQNHGNSVSIINCTITHIYGGNGGVGQDGSVVLGAIESGNDGGHGGNGGYANGIYISSESSVIKGNTIHTLWAGTGGDAGDGSDPGSAAGSPGAGGNGGYSGMVRGIYLGYQENTLIEQNLIFDLHKNIPGEGGNIGSDTHNTGYTSDRCLSGNSYHARGIYLNSGDDVLIKGNIIHSLYGNATTHGGYNGTAYAPNGINEPIQGICAWGTEMLEITQNSIYNLYVWSYSMVKYGLALELDSHCSIYLNHISDYSSLVGPISLSTSNYGNYWEENQNLVDLDPKDGLADNPYNPQQEGNILDHAPLSYPLFVDSDGDELVNLDEYLQGTSVFSSDTDGDTLTDSWEIAHGFDPCSTFNANLDHDLDGLNLALEYFYATDYLDPDSDADGWLDGDEIRFKTDPNNATDHPMEEISSEPDDSSNSTDPQPSDDDDTSDDANPDDDTDTDNDTDDTTDNDSLPDDDTERNITGFPVLMVSFIGVGCICSLYVYAKKNYKS